MNFLAERSSKSLSAMAFGENNGDGRFLIIQRPISRIDFYKSFILSDSSLIFMLVHKILLIYFVSFWIINRMHICFFPIQFNSIQYKCCRFFYFSVDVFYKKLSQKNSFLIIILIWRSHKLDRPLLILFYHISYLS